MSEEQAKAEHRSRPQSMAFREFVASGWAPRDETPPERAAVADYAADRRAEVSASFPGERLVIPAGGLKVRSNDTDYVFRPHSAFAHLTGLGADREPDSVLVLEPQEDGGHEAVLYFRPLAGRDTEEFFGDSRYGEFWVGARPTLADLEAELGLTARHIDEFSDAVAKDAGAVALRVVRDADQQTTARVDEVRAQTQEHDDDKVAEDRDRDAELARHLSELRLVKDPHEIEQMREAVRATGEGFEGVIRDLPEAVKRGRGERWVEGVFGLYARHAGNGVGYDSICASGDHANTLHWIKNTGDVKDGDLLLLDAGVEVDSLYTADITRTLPVSGTFTDAQRKVYDAVYAAQEAGIAAVKPGNKFSDVHAAAIRVIAEHLHEWGLLPDGIDVETTLDKEKGQYHRRWMVHGTSHHLGIDVHDCALARQEQYMEAELKPGMILTVEPGLYFKADDELIPAELRGIGVRIEDDVLVTEDGHENLSGFMPRSSADVEAWIARVQRR
ncbi:aminopeptidase P family protein [Calidifontibacter sp. DB0510]|uniref:Xaa-Pro aminopeptidase n=1 Tax=Metallococcus carri TaxID=1656884 RepID=A0A967B1Y4_9MICO|nr:aminopeptidase P family protein [Metallococcus carri]NHN56499.1 aminopeptidase P family protein [Metallococcus carri]NOP36123.1 aminopeptidase P family protein [Calidifontibacter sp. DB2511S]